MTCRRSFRALRPGIRPGPLDLTEKGGAISSKVFVGNLSFDTTSNEIETLFAAAGEVVKVVLPTDRDTGRPRGFGFVEFASDEAAAAAISKFHGFEHRGRNLRVNEAEERPQGSSGGFGRSFGSPDPGRRPSRPKGSRRNIRGRKRSL